MEAALEMALAAFDRSVLIMGPLLLVGGSFLVCVVGYVFFTTPFVSGEAHSSFTKAVLDVAGLWLWFNILFNWFMCWKTPPGRPPKEPPADVIGGAMCRKCDAFKPPRAHHCHVCRRCVLAMDHHCPWMANCIGFYNYRYFFLTLMYLTIGCVFVTVISAMEFGYFPLALGHRSKSNYRVATGEVVFVSFLCMCVGVAVGMLWTWHVYLVLSGQTTIEFYQRRASSPSRRRLTQTWFRLPFAGQPLESNDYDLGMKQNWAVVFGESKIPLSWAMPSLAPPNGDGMRWKNCRSLVSLV